MQTVYINYDYRIKKNNSVMIKKGLQGLIFDFNSGTNVPIEVPIVTSAY